MDYQLKTGLGVGAFRFLLLIIVKIWELKGGKKQIFIKNMSEISLYIDSHLVGKRAKRIFSRRMWMVFSFGLNHTSESSMRAKHTIYLPSCLATIHYYVAFPLADILFITNDPLPVPQESHNVDVHLEGSVMDIHREYTAENRMYHTANCNWRVSCVRTITQICTLETLACSASPPPFWK